MTGVQTCALPIYGHVARIGVKDPDIETSRFLARMVVAAATPRPGTGGLPGRPQVTDSGHGRVFIAGDWVGAEGWLADASIASGHEAARRALARQERAPVLVA